MGAKDRIRAMMIERGVTYHDLAQITDSNYHTTKNKILRGGVSYKFVEEIADTLGFDIIFRDRQGGKEV